MRDLATDDDLKRLVPAVLDGDLDVTEELFRGMHAHLMAFLYLLGTGADHTGESERPRGRSQGAGTAVEEGPGTAGRLQQTRLARKQSPLRGPALRSQQSHHSVDLYTYEVLRHLLPPTPMNSGRTERPRVTLPRISAIY
jgi:hypothetical protein